MLPIIFSASIEKDGRIFIPINVRKRCNLKHDDYIFFLGQKYEEIPRDFISEAFKEAIG